MRAAGAQGCAPLARANLPLFCGDMPTGVDEVMVRLGAIPTPALCVEGERCIAVNPAYEALMGFAARAARAVDDSGRAAALPRNGGTITLGRGARGGGRFEISFGRAGR